MHFHSLTSVLSSLILRITHYWDILDRRSNLVSYNSMTNLVKAIQIAWSATAECLSAPSRLLYPTFGLLVCTMPVYYRSRSSTKHIYLGELISRSISGWIPRLSCCNNNALEASNNPGNWDFLVTMRFEIRVQVHF